nr:MULTISPECIES: hypothetical protein [Bradyrhizobium]
MTTHVNKVHHVTTINRVAEDLGVDEDWLRDVANEMEIEDSAIRVYGVGEDGVQAFTNDLVDMHRLERGRVRPHLGRRDVVEDVAAPMLTRHCQAASTKKRPRSQYASGRHR